MFRVCTFLLLLLLSLPLQAARFGEPLRITSAGQGSDILIARQLFLRAGLAEPAVDARLPADSLAGVETLVVVVGGSAKGLGQAKDAADAELARVDALLDASAERRIQVLCLHLGRENRRGPLSDLFIRPVAERAQHLLILEGGDTDGYFRGVAEERGVPLAVSADYVELVQQINALFGWKLPPK
jgi:hypothetical protein